MLEQINDTTFRVPLGDDWVEIGNLDATNFEPHIMLSRWNRERKVKVMPHGVMGEVEIEVEADKIKSKYKLEIGGVEQEIETEFYVRPPTEQFEGGIAELDIILPTKPNDNRIILDIEAEGVNFFHQPPLTPEEIAEGTERPDNIVNSYALYDKVKRDHAIGGINYMCGKLFHIPRPRPVDALGNWCWADLLIENGKQIITIPWDFLNNAVYPIRHAAGDTFGKTDQGALTRVLTGVIQGPVASPASNGTGVNIGAWISNSQLDKNVKCALYDTSGNMIANGATEEKAVVAGDNQNLTFDFLAAPTLQSAATYWIFAWGEGNIGDLYLYYDEGGEPGGNRWKSLGYDGWPDPLEGTGESSFLRSVYCTYTPTAPPPGLENKSAGMAAKMIAGKLI